jgi:dienelactone hydrolase
VKAKHNRGFGKRVALLASLVVVSLQLAGCVSRPAVLAEIAPGVHGRIFLPESSSPHPAVVILHGRGGLRPIYDEEARLLAEHGYVALVLDYYADVRPGALSETERVRRWKAWEDSLVSGIAYLRSRADVDGQRIGILGVSQGATLALTSVHRLAGIRAVVDYFGPHPARGSLSWLLGCDPPADLFDAMPPTLILHGSWDPVVPVGNSRKLRADLAARGRYVELCVFPRAFHALNDAGLGFSNSPRVAPEARARALRFVDQHLGPAEISGPSLARGD